MSGMYWKNLFLYVRSLYRKNNYNMIALYTPKEEL